MTFCENLTCCRPGAIDRVQIEGSTDVSASRRIALHERGHAGTGYFGYFFKNLRKLHQQ